MSDVDDSEPQASDPAGDTDSETSSPAGLRLLLQLTPHSLYTCIFVYLYFCILVYTFRIFVNRCILYIFVYLYIFSGASCILYYTYICIFVYCIVNCKVEPWRDPQGTRRYPRGFFFLSIFNVPTYLLYLCIVFALYLDLG